MLITRENWDLSVCKGLLQMIPMIPSLNTEQQPASNSKWISNRHLQLNMSEIKLLVYPLNLIIPPNQWQHHSFKDWRTETYGHPWSLSLIPFLPANLAALPADSLLNPASSYNFCQYHPDRASKQLPLDSCNGLLAALLAFSLASLWVLSPHNLRSSCFPCKTFQWLPCGFQSPMWAFTFSVTSFPTTVLSLSVH